MSPKPNRPLSPGTRSNICVRVRFGISCLRLSHPTCSPTVCNPLVSDCGRVCEAAGDLHYPSMSQGAHSLGDFVETQVSVAQSPKVALAPSCDKLVRHTGSQSETVRRSPCIQRAVGSQHSRMLPPTGNLEDFQSQQ